MGYLPAVADHLCNIAKTKASDEADAFGRTAFNRYYYASYLSTRQLLSQIEREWGRAPHSDIPQLVEKTLINRLREAAKKLESNKLLTNGKAKNLINQAGSAGGEIASILKIAYKVRVAADYDPDKKVIFETATFKLAEHSESEAKNWLVRIDRHKGILLNISKELGLV